MHLLLIDAMNLIRRVYAAVEAGGNPEFAAEATRSKVLDIIHGNARGRGATHWMMVFEHHDETWRHRLWPEYKLGRSPMPEQLARDLPVLRSYLSRNGVHCYDQTGWEADDIIATAAVRAAENGLKVSILSTDKGFCQLVTPHIEVINHFDRLLWNEEQVRERWGFSPQRLPDFWALCGDQTNHLPGVSGIGKKGAAQVLDQCGTLDVAMGWPDSLPEKQAKLLMKDQQAAIRTRVLATLRTDIELGVSLASLRANL